MTAAESIFTKIIRREIPAKIAFENDRLIAIHDINPQAPLHLLFIPKDPIASVAEATSAHAALLGELLLAAADFARKEKLSSYRIVTNTGADAGQSVFHLHLHLLGGRKFSWPPG
jgi:histidine triad (HIT) family protein